MDGPVPTEQSETNPTITPKLIKGLDEAASVESWGGNAGPNRAGVNAVFIDGEEEFLFTNHPESGRWDLTFRLNTAPPRWLGKLLEHGRELPPALIDQVVVHGPENEARKAQFERRALEHNTQRILDFLKAGGEFDVLPETSFEPTEEQIEQLSGEVLK